MVLLSDRSGGVVDTDNLGGGISPSIVLKSGSQTFNNSTLGNVTGLSFALTSGRRYRFEFGLYVQSPTATVGIRAALTTPAFTRFTGIMGTPIAVDAAAAMFWGAITASADAVIPTAIPVINVNHILWIMGMITPSAGGNLQVQAANETGATVVTVDGDSWGMLWDLG